jgi:VIT1/CCC1 family predicted Fe2+/Mn2+ transporter
MKAENDVNKATQDESAVPSQGTGFIQSTLQTLARQPRTISDDTESASKLKFSDDVGLTAFLLRFGEGLEEVPNSRLFISAFTIGGAYFVGGLIPLIPYMIVKDVKHGLFWSVIVTAIVLVIFGILKAYHSKSARYLLLRQKKLIHREPILAGAKVGLKGYTSSALYTLAVGALAAGSSYAICAALPAE